MGNLSLRCTSTTVSWQPEGRVLCAEKAQLWSAPGAVFQKINCFKLKKNPKLSLDFIHLFTIFASTSWFYCARFPSTGIAGVLHHTQSSSYFKTRKPSALAKQASLPFTFPHRESACRRCPKPGPCVREGHSCTLTGLFGNTEHQLPPILTYPGMVFC